MYLPINHRLWSSSLLAVYLTFGLTACNDHDLQQDQSISLAVQQRFNRFDRDQSGQITVDELNRPALFYRVDRNDNGLISLQEASDYIEQRRATRRRFHAPAHRSMGVASATESDRSTPPVWASYPASGIRHSPPGNPPLPEVARNWAPETSRYALSAPPPDMPRRFARNTSNYAPSNPPPDMPRRFARNTNRALSDNNQPTDRTITGGGVRQFLNLAYATIPGVDPNLLSLDVYAPATGQNHPVIVMVHGGGWQRGDKANTNIAANKFRYFTRAGYVFVSINYRLSPAVKHPAHVQDVAKALAWTAKNISRYGGDPQHIYLMGHSAGAHLAALVATDQRYLQAVGENLGLLKGIILLDGAGYDIPKLMREHNQPDIYVQAFGYDERVWRDASPVTHIASGKSIPPFLIFYTPRTRSQMLTESLRKSLMSAGIPVQTKITNKSHAQINREVGQLEDGVTQSIMEFLK